MLIHLPTKRKCTFVKEFVLKGDGTSTPYVIAQFGKAFHYLAYPKEQYAPVADSVDESDSGTARSRRRKSEVA